MSEVLIVGAGPTGLVLGIELLRRGISIRIVDQKEGPSIHSKAMGIHARTLEIFEKMGIIERFLKEGLQCDSLILHLKEKTAALTLKHLPTPFPYVLILPQSDTEKILIKYFQELGGKVEWKTQFVGWENKQALLKYANDSIEAVEYPWIVGCDGAHSLVRHGQSISFGGEKLPETFLIADVKAKTSLIPLTGHGFFSKKGTVLVVPFPEKETYRFIFPDFKEKNAPLNVQFLSSLLQKRGFEVPISSIEPLWTSIFSISRRCVSQMRRGPVFLAGDAAHIHSPAGGQGMNTCIQDAFNLAWKLELVIREPNTHPILDSYEEERLPIAEKVLKGTTFFTKLLLFFQTKGVSFFFFILRLILNEDVLRNFLAMHVSQLSINYRKSSIVFQPRRDCYWKGPQPGERAPDALLENGKRLFLLFQSPKHILLLFKDNPDFISAIEKTFEKWIDVRVLKSKNAEKIYAAETNSVYLIRPDGYIGYRSRILNEEETIKYLKGFFYGFKPSLPDNKL